MGVLCTLFSSWGVMSFYRDFVECFLSSKLHLAEKD